MRMITKLSLSALLLAQPLAAQDAADSAWTAGDHARARTLYTQRLAANTNDPEALHRLGLMLAWNREFPEAVKLLDRLLTVAPNPAARMDRANVLAWSGDYNRAIQAVDELVAENAAPADARHIRARFLSWAGRFDAAEAAYRELLSLDPRDAEALRGLARVTSWRGDLGNGEQLWRRVLTAEPENVDARIGLSQVLRWRGQPRAALEEARAAAKLAPDNRDVQLQLDWAEAAFAPRLAPSVAAEFDSDDNTLITTALTASGYLGSRVSVSAHGYVRRAEGGVSGHLDSRAGSLGLRLDLGRGWTMAGSAGAVDRTAPGADMLATWGGSLATPAAPAVSASLAYARGVMDGTALLIQNGITSDEMTFGLNLRLGADVRAEAATAVARFYGVDENDRILGRVSLDMRASRSLRLRPRVAAFSFKDDLNEGYFDPDFYGLAELGIGYDRYTGAWGFSAEVAPGAQRVGSNADITGALSARARVGYTIAPGREIGVSFALSNLGMERFEPNAAGYRYQAAVLSAAWGF